MKEPSTVSLDDRQPKSRKSYRNDPLKREDQEAKEYVGSYGVTPIIQGDWKLNVHSTVNKLGYRRYHRHGKRWFCVISEVGLGGAFPTKWKCGHCSEPVPEEMEGYINLARWATDANS